MEIKIFRFSRLELWDYITMVLYAFLTIYIHITLTKDRLPSNASTLISGYIYGTAIFNYMVNYKSLRNMSVFFIWMIFCGYHYWLFRQLDEFIISNNDLNAKGLQYSIVILIIQQLIRYIYISS